MAKRGPNILFILTDSSRVGEMGCYGNARIKTPQADRLAAEGVTFTQAYTTAPICHPARASISTGLFPHGNGVLTNVIGKGAYPYRILDGVPRTERVLAEAGYLCGYAGQGHTPLKNGWTEARNGYDAFKRWLDANGLQEGAEPPTPGALYGVTTYSAEHARDAWNARGAIELMERFSARGRPWFIHCDLDHPHPPFNVAPEFSTLYRTEEIPKPANFDDTLAGKPEAQAFIRRRESPDGARWDEFQPLLAHYWGLVSQTDHYVGWLLDKLDALGQAEDTLVVLASDHGELIGAHGLRWKSQVMYDEVLRVPLLARWPGKTKAGERVNGFVSHVDLLPSFAEAAGAPPPAPTHGRSWVLALAGDGSYVERDDITAQYHGSGHDYYTLRMVRTDQWKYVYTPFGRRELYHLADDPAELTNLSEEPAYADVEVEMRRRLLAWAEWTGDPAAMTLRIEMARE